MHLIRELRLHEESIRETAKAIDLRNVSILVTGATGLIGSCIIDTLLVANKEFGTGIKIYALSRSREKLEKRFGTAVIPIVQDIMNPLDKEIKYDYIIHGASNADPKSYATQPVETILTNIIGNKNILDYCVSHKEITKMILTSSFEVYGELNGQDISSLYVAREHIENAIILDGDQIIYNSEILAPEFERSGYNSVWTDVETDEWLQTVENGIVTACSRTGGKGGWQLYSISRWTAEDGKKLKRHLEIEFEQKKNRQIYWDDVVMFCYLEEYQLGISPMNKDDIIEVDNLSELIALDASYKKYAEEK